MDRPAVIPVDNETESSISRTTAEGRTLTYQMKVLQQPVRARACGQGAKSSADRRPVDPPPIVELRVFEGQDRENDITFTMHANYFLFATLENARPIAHGRVSADRHTPPVLTGTPVAGMVYLDRPHAAGYFIFPDLSVRHEGNYRLSFSLYEELKSLKDEDKMSEEAKANGEGAPVVNHRLEVKSEPFQVFSAKKFPGLTESTALSRMVAEQGCRVRIRRDVRMRRRETKGSAKDWDEYEDDTAGARARMSSTPENQAPFSGMMHTPHSYVDPIARPRSAGNASHQSLAPVSRRESVQDLNSAYPGSQFGTAPHTPQNSFQQSGPYGPSPTQTYQQGPYVQQAPPMQPPPPQYQHGYSAPPPPAPVNGSHQGYYAYAPGQPGPVQPAHQQFEPMPQQQHRASVAYSSQSQAPADARRYSVQQPALPPPPQLQLSYQQQAQQSAYPPQAPSQPQTYQQIPASQAQQSSHSYSSSMDMYNNSRPAHPQSMPQQSRPNGAHTPMSSRPFDLPPLQTASGMLSNNKLEASSPSSAAPTNSYFSAAQTAMDTHKRSYGHVFSEKYQDQPLRQGARPGASASDYSMVTGSSLSAVDDDDTSGELDPDSLSMQYRRADGRAIRRALPGHV
ncbi:Putative velvet factor [Septoria linicola]|uniref:Velvet factor n=1 Tax=Septoria linicola TaxID=215465 RepID=A0A9Q9EHC1_9PEZI|nr:Putative velvet factor [Septoria linicola]